LAAAAGTILTLPSGSVRAADILGVYVGGATGRAEVEATVPYVDHFKKDHLAFKMTAGVRPIPLVGAEVAYVDLGHPRRLVGFIPTDVSMKGAAAVINLYLPLPIVALYAQAGVARLQSSATAVSVCPPGVYCLLPPTVARIDRRNVGFVAGGGAQVKLGAFALRAEYERFNAAGGHPTLVSLGVTWTFL